LLRHLEYLALEGIELRGRTLDIGGGRRSGYYDLMTIRGRIDSLNINPALQPTCIADFGTGLPVRSGAYDQVLCLNTLEHIRNEVALLPEIVRVLRPGGVAYILVPFLYRVHASPDDYHRHTASFWEHAFGDHGIPADVVDVWPLTFGPLAAPLSLVEFRVPPWLRRFARVAVLSATTLKTLLRPASIDDGSDLPLGYFIHATKPLD
jgi:SAM-dependent methyltransferase